MVSLIFENKISSFCNRKGHYKVTIVDMDTVNPYYRTKDVQEILEAKGIRVIAPQFANTNVDILSVPSDILSVFDDPECVAVFDVGGDDEGAIVLGMYQRYLLQCGYDMLFVFNARRPLTATGDDTLEMFEAIQNTSRLRFSGIINNTNLMEDTTPEIVLEGQQAAQAYRSGISQVCQRISHCCKMKKTSSLSLIFL